MSVDNSPMASRASTEEIETPVKKRGRKPGSKNAEKRKAEDGDDEPPAKKQRGPKGRPSKAHQAAVALANGTIWIDDFLEERLGDPKVHALMQKIRVRATPELDLTWPDAYPFIVTVTMRDGRTFTREIHYAKGHPKNPMSDAEIDEKFRKLSQSVLGPEGVDRALRVLWGFADLPKVSDVFEPFVLDPARALAAQ